MSSFNWPPQASGAGGGVTSLNTLTGDIVLAAGTGITLTPVGQTITIAATTTGTVSSVGLALPSIFTVTNSPVTTTGTLTGTLNTQAANLVFAGPTTGVAATPTFRSLVSADISTLFGNLTDVGTDGIVITGGTGVVLGAGTSIAQHVADSTHNGYLSSTDWSTFNGKQASGNYITDLTGDVTASGPGSVAATIGAGKVTATKLGTITDGVTLDQLGTGSTLEIKTGSISPAYLSGITDGSSLDQLGAGNTLEIAALGVTSGKIAAGAVSLAKMANLAANSIIGNNTGSPATPLALTVAQVNTLLGTLSNPMSAVSDIIIGGAAGTPTRLAIGGAGKVLRSDATNLTYSYPEPTIAAKVANYTTTANDNLVNCDSSGGTFTITLLAAATAGSGKRYIVRKTDSSLTAVTVSDVAATLSTTLNTQNETIELYTDGSTWFVLNRIIPSNWVSYTPTATGPGSNNTQSGFWKRVGDSMLFKMRIIWSGSPGTFSSIVMSLPSGITVDTTKLIVSTTLKEWAAQGIQFSSAGGTTTYPAIALYASTTTVQLKTFSAGTATYGDVSNSSPAAIQNTDYIEVNGNLPVSGWNG